VVEAADIANRARHALETDWLAERRDSTKTLRLGGGIPTFASQNSEFTETFSRGQDSNLRIPIRNLVGSAALILMHRFESCRPAFA
jgi:hypothetical protein